MDYEYKLQASFVLLPLLVLTCINYRWFILTFLFIIPFNTLIFPEIKAIRTFPLSFVDVLFFLMVAGYCFNMIHNQIHNHIRKNIQQPKFFKYSITKLDKSVILFYFIIILSFLVALPSINWYDNFAWNFIEIFKTKIDWSTIYSATMFWHFTQAVIVYFLLSNQYQRGEIKTKDIQKVLLLSLTLVIIFCIWQYFNPGYYYYSSGTELGYWHSDPEEISGTFGHPNITGGYIGLVIMIPFMLFISRFISRNISTKKLTKDQLIGALIFILGIFCIYKLTSRAVLIGVFISMVVYGMYSIKKFRHQRFKSHRKTPNHILVLFVLIIIVTIFIGAAALVKNINSDLSLNPDYSITRRTNEIWPNSIMIILQDSVKMFFGHGLGTFSYTYKDYIDNNLIEQRGTEHAHNVFLQFAIELGLLGVLAFLFVLNNAFRKNTADDKLQIAIKLGLIVFLTHNLFDYTFYWSELLLMFFAVLALLNNGPIHGKVNLSGLNGSSL
ncbi:O-antigen ligase family protein [Candidatus Woesearchaeota archaeon]|nr:O-antigen ligase family protein [Candidatus Woesearchaeota archaeon]